MTDTVEAIRAIRPPKTKGSFRRRPQGQLVMLACALLVIELLNAIVMTFEKWFAAGCNLAAIGVNHAKAVAELKPPIPSAHVWYNESGYGQAVCDLEAYFSGSLINALAEVIRNINSEIGGAA
jgi:hypothetical protein